MALKYKDKVYYRMSMNRILRVGDYEMVKHNEGLAPYAIFKRADGFWQQVSKWYCSMGWADKKLKQLLKKEAKNANRKNS